MAKTTTSQASVKSKNSRQKKPEIDLKKFRHDIAVLKKKGLVSSRVDTRTVKPSKTMLKRIEDFKDVLAGTVKVWHVKKRRNFEEFLRAGERGSNMHIVLNKGEWLVKDRIAYKEEGRTMYRDPMDRDMLASHIETWIDKHPIKNGEGYVFEIYEGKSRMVFYRAEQMITYLMGYKQINYLRQKVGERIADKEIISNLKISKVSNPDKYLDELPVPTEDQKRKLSREWIEVVPSHLEQWERKETTPRRRRTKRERIRGKS